VVTSSFGFDQAIQKIGVERRLYTHGSKKSLLDPFLPEKPEDVDRIKRIQEQIHNNFISDVRERRGNKLKENENDLFSGEIWVGKAAVDVGLVDGIGDLWTVVRNKYGKDTKVEIVAGRSSLFERLMGNVSSSLADEIQGRVELGSLNARYGL